MVYGDCGWPCETCGTCCCKNNVFTTQGAVFLHVFRAFANMHGQSRPWVTVHVLCKCCSKPGGNQTPLSTSIETDFDIGESQQFSVEMVWSAVQQGSLPISLGFLVWAEGGHIKRNILASADVRPTRTHWEVVRRRQVGVLRRTWRHFLSLVGQVPRLKKIIAFLMFTLSTREETDKGLGFCWNYIEQVKQTLLLI